ncbi:MAG: transglutaminase domain-containing protein, partial [Gammaproteobacteria bacterium]|nr:transglutaminase domain-containing protein [Gammaproteobacteria bacterium]
FGLMALAGATGFAGHLGLNHLQQWVINAGVDLLAGGGTRTDPYRSMTGLGHIGTLKLSDRILLRVAIEGDLPRPLLLHRATYNQYVYRNWIAREAPLAPIKPDGDGVSWTFQNQTVPGKAVTVSTYLERGLGVLALPTDLSRLSRLPVTVLKKNRLGTIRVEGESGFTRYQALIGDRISLMDVPTGDDLQIPEQEQPVVMQAVRELDLVGGAPEKILESVANYFSDNFQYSLAQRGEQSGTPLNDFLTRSRAGHCEYFATATVLLLRAAGIPARYATGFSVQEYSNLEEVYLVRQRHAHAWVMAYVNGGWNNVDNTPSSWYGVERDNAAAWEPLMDLWWWARYRFSTWSKEGDVGELALIAFSPIVLVGFFFLWRWLSKRRRTAGRDGQAVAKSQAWPGRDSPFYRIMHRLRGEGLEQRPEEPLTAWVERLSSSGSGLPQAQQLREIVHLHYRYRFHAQGLSREEKATLDDQVNEWLENWEVQAR